MTLQEICEKYKVSEDTIKANFPRVQASILKKYGVKITKEGRGENVKFKEEVHDDQRAISMYQETKDEIITFNKGTMKLMNWNFITFLAIAVTPMGVFRGSYKDFLKYIEITISDDNEQQLKEALNELYEKGLIRYEIDKTDFSYFVAYVYKQVEDDMKLGIEMVRDCKRLQKTYNKRSWIPILKVWLCVNMFVEEGHQPYTVNDIKAVTGLSNYQVRDSVKILNKSQVFKTSKAYASYTRCLGTTVDLNVDAFYELDKKQ